MEHRPEDIPRVSLTVIARRRIPELDRLVATLLELDGPSREILVGIETPGADTPSETCDDRGVRWLALPAGRGIGYNRNRVLEAARGDLVFGVDDDCEPCERWLLAFCEALDDPDIDGAIGSIEIPPSGYLGDAISALGFPAGGNAGYETMFHVAEDGTTDNVAAGNCALRTSVMRDVGGYDESMTWGGEDTELAWRLGVAGRRLRYVPEARISHPARTSLREFSRWFYVRGRAKRQFARKVPVGGFVSARLASYRRILKANATDAKILVIAPLLVASVLLQQAGFLVETLRPTRRSDLVRGEPLPLAEDAERESA